MLNSHDCSFPLVGSVEGKPLVASCRACGEAPPVSPSTVRTVDTDLSRQVLLAYGEGRMQLRSAR